MNGLPKVLLTGFEPFDGEAVNPSWMAVQALASRGIAGVDLATAQLPVAFRTTPAILREAIAAEAPQVVIAVGQARGIVGLSLERVAINLADARIPDNLGEQPMDCAVVEGGPSAYFTGLPVKAILADLLAAGIPAQLSHSAGTFLCNQVFYLLCHLAATGRPGLRAGFIHLPLLPEQAARHRGEPSLALELAAHGLERAVLATLSRVQDLAVPGGSLN